MKPFSAAVATDSSQGPSEELRIAITFRGAKEIGLTKFSGRMSTDSVEQFKPSSVDMDEAIHQLHKHGFTLSGRGSMTLSVRGSRALFEKAFGTKLSVFDLPKAIPYSEHSFYFPAEGAPWNPDKKLSKIIDEAYIQWPHIYMARATNVPAAKTMADKKPSAKKVAAKTTSPVKPAAPKGAVPPKVGSYYNLDVLKDVPRLLNVVDIHKQGHKGEGMRIAMIDTGFAHSHPFFTSNGFVSSVVLAPSATSRTTDPGSHGTGESANIFAIAPKATFIGVKLGDDANPTGGASILEGFQEALKHKPHVISISMGYDLRIPPRSQITQLPNNLKGLEGEIQAAIASGIVIVFSAGNGHYAFPGSMPEVVSAGGVYVDAQGKMRASDYASAFPSAIYSGRNVPDFCGLVGMLPHADYIMLPVPPGEEMDKENALHDATKPNDGWAVFSGTSAAAPQLAGVCALLLQKKKSLSASDLKAILRRTATDVTVGRANPASDSAGQGIAAGPGQDGATGAGLVNAFAAWKQITV